MESTQRIYAAELAKLIGKTERTARRTLEALEEKHGSAVVRRDGPERYTTLSDFERVTATQSPRPKASCEAKLMMALRRVLSDVAAAVARIDELEVRLAELGGNIARSRCMLHA